ncbi:MAG TPA: hypothetical protein VMD79_13235 [Solirubrobacteraceae bacterium]|nr:hypothetical protein [Solirubrobacteraceae bacterium]
MPTATTSSPAGAKPRAKRASAAKKPTAAKRNAATTQARTEPARVSDYAERAVLIPVGAALIARDRVVDSVTETLSTYSSPSKAQTQLRRFERRGTTARNRLEREVRKARVRAERQLRQRRRTIESTVSELEERRDAFAKSSSELFSTRIPELANQVQERILSLV